MTLSTDQDYEGYLERFAATGATEPALSRSDFYRYSDQLDELHLLDIECGLDSAQHQQLEELSALLLEQPLDEEFIADEGQVPIIEIGDAADRRIERSAAERDAGQDTPVLFRQPRRAVWRLRRHRR